MIAEFVISILEIIGTVAFAVSGALIGVSCRLDLFGVVFIGCVTSVGGGVLRDIIIGKFPPNVFCNTSMLFVAAAASLVVFITAYINAERFEDFREKIERINNIFDAIGLSAFTVTGTEIAYSAGYGDKVLLCVMMGMITGVGGGIFRDVLVNKPPYVLTKHIYALAAIFGGLLYYIIRINSSGTIAATAAAMTSVVIIRMLATYFHWKLPKIQIGDNESL